MSAEREADATVKGELGEESGLVEEDLVAVSYMGDELDLETVGEIIAIIEEKVCDPDNESGIMGKAVLCDYTEFRSLIPKWVFFGLNLSS